MNRRGSKTFLLRGGDGEVLHSGNENCLLEVRRLCAKDARLLTKLEKKLKVKNRLRKETRL